MLMICATTSGDSIFQFWHSKGTSTEDLRISFNWRNGLFSKFDLRNQGNFRLGEDIITNTVLLRILPNVQCYTSVQSSSMCTHCMQYFEVINTDPLRGQDGRIIIQQ